jgi:interleukin-1 receptor-associated kinase 1
MHADEAPRPAAAPSKLRKVGSEGMLVLAVPKDVEEFRTMSAYGRLKLFTYDELRKATGDFNPGQIVGEGAFGVVYRGVIDGAVRKGYPPTEVAVKVLNPEGLQGDREWLVRLRHIHSASP